MSLFRVFTSGKANPGEVPFSFYDLSCKTIDGGNFYFSTLKGKKVLIVNVASNCGYTPQYEDIEKLNKEFGKDGLIIIGFPSNDFFRQESGSNDKIKLFCQSKYGVTFPMMSKLKVKGRNQHIIYKWLTSRKLNGVMNSKVKWNFQKYMISREGLLVGLAEPRIKPYSKVILDFIKS